MLTCSVDLLNKRAPEAKRVIKLALNCLEVIICWGKIRLVLEQSRFDSTLEGKAGALGLAKASILIFGEEESCLW